MHLSSAQHQAITNYYRELDEYTQQRISHEGATRSAFQNLLSAFAREKKWTLIPELKLPGKQRHPDGTVRDEFNLPHGYWEAKDTKDDLDAEIAKKIKIGYPTTNIIFEDTRRAVLYQNRTPVYRADLTKRQELLDLLAMFYGYTEPDIAGFKQAVQDFKERIPELARGLLETIEREHLQNKTFQKAFATFFELCRTALNPAMSQATIDEMLVQHLLTERLFRTIFDNPDFVNRNVIAAEIERVILALTSRSFNRSAFQKELDRFYLAIEDAARTLTEWKEKQAFLNTVYERFFQGFSIRQADTHGIVYTPQEIVDFMCASVEVALRNNFGVSLSTPGVQILDPATGTGNFIVNLIQKHITGGALAEKYANDLFCNEIMLLPYYIASLNIEHAYYERTGRYEPFEGLCFTDTLNLAVKAEGVQQPLALFSQENTKRVQREEEAKIKVIIGNPPYNVGQRNENDNNKNRKYHTIDHRISTTYIKDSKATLHTQLYDAYIRFFRWAVDRLQGSDGIVCLVSNNSFIDQIAFDGMRKHLLQDFTTIYHLDLHGNVRKNPKLSGTTHNVFGIQVGVGITIAIRKAENTNRTIYYNRVPEFWRKIEKLAYLAEKKSITGIEWQELVPDEQSNWITEGIQANFYSFLPMGSKEGKAAPGQDIPTLFKLYSNGVKTNRDTWVYDFDTNKLATKMKRFIDTYNGEIDRWKRRSNTEISIDDFVTYDDTRMKWSGDLKVKLTQLKYASFLRQSIRNSLFRPFTKRYLFFDQIFNNSRYLQHLFFPTPTSEAENIVIWLKVGSEWPMFALVTNIIPDLLPQGGSQCFPFYTYKEDGSGRRENITDWALLQFQGRYGEEVTKGDIFSYVYAMLHHPQYRELYAENLKRDLPHIPLLTEGADFAVAVRIGKALLDLHLAYEQAREYPLTWQENHDVPITWEVKKMHLSADKRMVVVNDWLTLSGVPEECFSYRLGNRSALDWILDQYQVSEDKRSGIVSDPNRSDDPEYIVRLVGRVITVSVETVKLVRELHQTIQAESWG